MDGFLCGKRVAVIGMARSGIGAAKLAKRLGGSVLVSDRKQSDDLAAQLEELSALGIESETGGHARIEAEKFDVVILSPGVAPRSNWLDRWGMSETEVWSELELASRSWNEPWIGVTGSNGKTTTVNLIHGLLREAGYDAIMCGNVGVAWSSLLPAKAGTVFVVEVSSYQLEHSPSIRPRIGVLLNLYENHLDRHGTMSEYAETKARLFRNQAPNDVAVLNANNRWVRDIEPLIPSNVIRFGEGAEAIYQNEDGNLVQRVAGGTELLITRDELPLPGHHNALNALAASAAALAYGCTVESVRAGLRKARPVEHRIEFVRDLGGVSYYNDSKSTNLIATMTALDSFQENVILLFGGRFKPESFAPLANRFPAPVRAMIVFGEAVEKVKRELPSDLPIQYVSDLSDAVAMASRATRRGDIVLLSPGCASFDQFRDFEQRGEKFKSLVSNL